MPLGGLHLPVPHPVPEDDDAGGPTVVALPVADQGGQEGNLQGVHHLLALALEHSAGVEASQLLQRRGRNKKLFFVILFSKSASISPCIIVFTEQ